MVEVTGGSDVGSNPDDVVDSAWSAVIWGAGFDLAGWAGVFGASDVTVVIG